MGICVNQIRLLQNFALLLQILHSCYSFCTLVTVFALLLQVFALLQIFPPLFGINWTEIDQSQSSIIYVYIIDYETKYYHLQITSKISSFETTYRLGRMHCAA